MRPFRFLSELLSPPACLVCGERLSAVPGQDAPALCPDCALAWEIALRAQCPQCYAAYPMCLCATPVMRKAGVTTLVKLGPYSEETAEKPIRAVVLHAKRQRSRRLFAYLAGELRPGIMQALEKENISPERCVLTWLPRSRRAFCREGVDQAKELALALSASTGIAAERLLCRRRDARTQKELTAKARLENLRNAFGTVGDPGGRVVLLCDDLVTTGAGMAVGFRLLKAAGAERVIGVSVAVRPRKKDVPVLRARTD